MSTGSAIVAGTPLLDEGIRAINFFNGRLVTGGDLTRDQEARRAADARLGQAIGPGVVQGLEVQVAGDPKDQKLRVSKGLALNTQGQALALGNDQVLALVPDEEDTAAAAADTFGDCKPLSGGTYVAGEGLYLVTLAPAVRKSGKAEVLALEPGNLRCNSDVVVEGVQLRVLHLRPELLDDYGFDTEVRDPKPVSLLRSALAAACFGDAPAASARARVPQAAGPTLLGDMLAHGLDPSDVPLALVFLNADDGVKFVDTWAVRRQVGPSVAAAGWAPWFGEPRDAVAQARIAQFQQHLAEVRRDASASLKAGDWFQWLPPAGFLARSGDDAVRWESFLDPRQPAREVALAAGDAPAVLAEALRRDPVPLAGGTSTRFRVYVVDGGPSLFVRDARNARHAEEVWFDAQRSGIAANEVQSAIEKLWARSCVSFVLHGDADARRLESFAREMRGRDVVLCIESGEFKVEKTLVLQGLRHLVIHGHGAGSLLRSRMDAVLRIEHCESVFISDLALDARGEDTSKDEQGIGVAGALTVIDTPVVHVLRVQATCAERTIAPGGFKSNERPKAAAMALTHSGKGLEEDRGARQVRVEDCELRVGAGQQGLGCFHWHLLTVRGNLVVAQGGKQPMLGGIVLGGAVADEVRVEQNAVGGALRGIWLALSVRDEKSDPTHLQVRHAVLARNRIQVIAANGDNAPGATGIYVGNTESLLVEGNHVAGAAGAALEESRGRMNSFRFDASGGDGIRAKEEPGSARGRALHLAGVYGPRIVVRDNHLRGFPRPVQFELKGQTGPEGAVLWLFHGNLAEGAKTLVDAEGPVLERLRGDDNEPPVRS